MVKQPLGRFCTKGIFNPSSQILHNHLVEDEIFQVYRIIRKGDTHYVAAKEQYHGSERFIELNGETLIDFLAYDSKSGKLALVRTFDGDYLELNSIDKIVKASNNTFGAQFGKPGYKYYNFCGTEEKFFKMLGYKFVS